MDNLEKKLEVLFELEKYNEVLALAYENISGSHGNELLLYYHIISSYVNLDKYDEALNSCNEAIGKYPQDDYLFFLKSKICSERNQKDDMQALENIKIAIDLSSNDPKYFRQEARIYYSLSDYINAKKSIDIALELDSTDIDAQLTKGTILYMMNKQEEAYKIIDEVLEKDPHNEIALRMLQHYTVNLKDKKRILQGLLQSNPQDKEYQTVLKLVKYYYKFVPASMLIVLVLSFVVENYMSSFWFLDIVVGIIFLIVAVIGSNDERFNIAFISGYILIHIGLSLGGLILAPIIALFLTLFFNFVYMYIEDLYFRR